MEGSRASRSFRIKVRPAATLLRLAFPRHSGKLRRVKVLARLGPRHGAAILAGLLLAASFPKPGLAGLAWIAPGLMLFAAVGQPGKECFRIGYFAGLANYLCSLYWLLFIPFPAGAIVGWFALSAYLALYPAVWVWLCWRLFSGKKFVAAQTWWSAVGEFFTTDRWQRSCWMILCAGLWVALDMVVARFLSGFPWNFLGVSQYRMLPLIQIASVTGVYGVSFLVVWFSISLAIAFLRVVRQPRLRWGWLIELRLALIALIGTMIFGLDRLLVPLDTDRQLIIALVQPSIRQDVIWNHAKDADRFNKIIELSKLAIAVKPDLLIWPESSMPNFTEDNFRAITDLIVANKVWMILGADDAEPRPGATSHDDYDSFNAAFLFNRQGKVVATYHKQHLVVFGEYLPFARWLPFLRRVIPIPGDFTPGDRPVPFELDAVATVYDRRTHDSEVQGRRSQTAATGGERSKPAATTVVKLCVLICFEDVIACLARESSGDDIDFMLNLTNDGWFGESAAQWQQAANAVFRAVENGLPLVRCTNNGLTCWIDSRGAIREILGGEGKAVYAPGFMTAKIPLRPAGQKRVPTFYHRHGDWFGWGCVALSALACVIRLGGRGPTRAVI